jgi:hypothetical protein
MGDSSKFMTDAMTYKQAFLKLRYGVGIDLYQLLALADHGKVFLKIPNQSCAASRADSALSEMYGMIVLHSFPWCSWLVGSMGLPTTQTFWVSSSQ